MKVLHSVERWDRHRSSMHQKRWGCGRQRYAALRTRTGLDSDPHLSAGPGPGGGGGASETRLRCYWWMVRRRTTGEKLQENGRSWSVA